MALLFIDSNKYLDFFRSEQVAKLVPVLSNLRSCTVVTEQIVDEVHRNKATVFVTEVENRLRTETWTIPEQLLPSTGKADQIRKEFRKHRDKADHLRHELIDFFDEIRRQISQSEDHISASLDGFFGVPSAPTEDQVCRARKRKDLGNPPGKKSDPLGDQINWEQFLDAAAGHQAAWIISADDDYFITVPGKGAGKKAAPRYLNPKLMHELRSRKPGFVAHCFNSLSVGLNHFISEQKLSRERLPSDSQMEMIADEEDRLWEYLRQTVLSPAKPRICPKCQASDSFFDGAHLNSQYGSSTLQFVCRACNFHVDTGDMWS